MCSTFFTYNSAIVNQKGRYFKVNKTGSINVDQIIDIELVLSANEKETENPILEPKSDKQKSLQVYRIRYGLNGGKPFQVMIDNLEYENLSALIGGKATELIKE